MSLVIFVCYFAHKAHADTDELLVDGALGVFNTDGKSISQVKFAKVGIQEDVWYALKQRFNVGTWVDSRGPGFNTSGFAGYQVGFDVKNDVMEAGIFSGPTLITSPDIDLGGVFQFNETVFLGVRDKGDESIGVVYNHLSSAGLEMPNLGKDFMGIEIKFPF